MKSTKSSSAAVAGDSLVSIPYLTCGDACAWLRSLPDGTIDCIVTDPAYESLEKHRAKGTTTRLKVSKASSNEWFPIFWNDRFKDLFSEMYRVLAKDAHLYMYCDEETSEIVKPIGRAVGFTFWKSIIWDKQRIGMGYHYRNRTERILFFEKGKRRLNDLGISDLISHPSVRGKSYPTEKPPEVSEILIRNSTEPGEIIADMFMGSGSVGVAAIRAGRQFIGCDIKPSAMELTAQRIADAEAAMRGPNEDLC